MTKKYTLRPIRKNMKILYNRVGKRKIEQLYQEKVITCITLIGLNMKDISLQWKIKKIHQILVRFKAPVNFSYLDLKIRRPNFNMIIVIS